jgi:osmotically-inducible protein OsmY
MSTAIREPVVPTKARSDAELQRLVLDELCWDSDVREASVGVEVDRGTVTLTGTVGTFSEKIAAQRAAHRVEGVHDVANDLTVVFSPNPVADDTRIAQAVRHALEADTRIPDAGIQVTVSKGFVTLDGKVSNWLARYRAEQAVENLHGVVDVFNRIIVTPSPVREAEVRSAIEQALERQTAHRTKRIQVDLVDGIVTLTGSVRSWPEREAAFQAAVHAPGVRSVVNHLRVEPYA